MESAAHATSIRSPPERFVDGVALATAGRTPGWLDQLTAAGHLTVNQRGQLAAEDGATTLARLLRRAELAGHDPRQVLHDAVTAAGLVDARSLTNVIHHRINDRLKDSLEPAGDTYADWAPAVDDPQAAYYLGRLAALADAQRTQLGRDAAADQPQLAVEALGGIPDGIEDRAMWQERAAIVAAHRELTGHDNPATALGRPPNAGQAEIYASWRAAWRARGRPEDATDEATMSVGKLRIRVRTYDREQTWAPRYVANELAGTRQAAERQQQTATLRATEAATAAISKPGRARLQAEAADAASLADVLDQRIGQLEQADQARGDWLVHTAETRANADRAERELNNRNAARQLDERPSADEWLAEHDQAMRAEDPHREITAEHDLTDIAAQEAADTRTDRPHPDAAASVSGDIRDSTADEPIQVDIDLVRIPTAEETADTIQRAQEALTELEARLVQDEQHAVDDTRRQELARWQADDLGRTAVDEHAADTAHTRQLAMP